MRTACQADSRQMLMKKIREELLLFNPEKTAVLEGLRELAENFRTVRRS